MGKGEEYEWGGKRRVREKENLNQESGRRRRRVREREILKKI